MKDLCLTDPKMWSLICHENLAQLEKWGVQDHSPFEWLTYTAEELGETAKAIGEEYYRNGDSKAVVKEAIQAATLCLKIAEMYKHKGEANESK